MYYLKPKIEKEKGEKEYEDKDRFKNFPEFPIHYQKGRINVLHGSWKKGSWTQLGGAIKENTYIRVERNGIFITGKVEAYGEDKDLLEWQHGNIKRNASFERFEPNNNAKTISMIKKDHYWGE